MHLAVDYIHPTPRDVICRIRIYLPEDERDAPVVICSELPNNEGSSVTYSAHQIAAEVIRYHKLALPPIWIEHYPKEATDGASETFELVVFSSYKVTEQAPYLGETRLTIGEPSWKSLDREAVEGSNRTGRVGTVTVSVRKRDVPARLSDTRRFSYGKGHGTFHSLRRTLTRPRATVAGPTL